MGLKIETRKRLNVSPEKVKFEVDGFCNWTIQISGTRLDNPFRLLCDYLERELPHDRLFLAHKAGLISPDRVKAAGCGGTPEDSKNCPRKYCRGKGKNNCLEIWEQIVGMNEEMYNELAKSYIILSSEIESSDRVESDGEIGLDCEDKDNCDSKDNCQLINDEGQGG